MRVSKRQLKRIIKEAMPPHDVIDAMTSISMESPADQDPRVDQAVLGVFYATGRVSVQDVFDRLRMEGMNDEEIDEALSDAGL